MVKPSGSNKRIQNSLPSTISTVGWFNNQMEAVTAVLKDISSISDNGYYSHAIIEKMPEGFHKLAEPENCIWFELIDEVWTQVDKPKWSKGICCWSMG